MLGHDRKMHELFRTPNEQASLFSCKYENYENS